MRHLKFAFFIYVIFSFNCIVNAQNWQSLGGGTSFFVRSIFADSITNRLYVVGNFLYAGDSLVFQIAAWNGTNWEKVGNGTRDTNCIYGCNPIGKVIKFGNDIFTSGSYNLMDGLLTNHFASRWDGNQWFPCGNPDSPPNFCISNNELFAVGIFDTISNQHIERIAKWDGNNWESFGSELPFTNMVGDGYVCTGEYYNGEYYFAGNFNSLNDEKEIIRWDGVQWKSLQNGVLGDSWINDIVVYKNTLFVGGYFFKSDGNCSDFIMAWNGHQWFEPFPNIQFMTQVIDLKVIEDKLYIVGNFIVPNDTGMYAFARYDGTNFCPFGGEAYYPNYPDPFAIDGLNGEIYVGCNNVLISDTVHYIAKLINNQNDTCITIPLFVEPTVSVNENLLKIFPNPTSSDFCVKFLNEIEDEYTITLYDIQGKLIRIFTTKEPETVIDISLLPEGVYGVMVVGNGIYFMDKVVKIE